MDSEQQYVRGFNHGYILAQHEPELLLKVTKQLTPQTVYVQGLFDGQKELELENNRNQLNELRKVRDKLKDRGEDLER